MNSATVSAADSRSQSVRQERFAAGLPYSDWVPLTPPAAGAPLTFELDAQYAWQVLAFHADMTAAVVAVTRTPALQVRDPDGNVWHSWIAQTQLLSGQHRRYWWSVPPAVQSQNVLNDNSRLTVSTIPRLWLPGGWTLALAVDSIQAADTITEPRMAVLKRLSAEARS